MDLRQILRSVMLFSKLSDDDLEKVSALCKMRKLARGEVLAKQGTPGTEFYIVTHGFVEVSVDSDLGGESSVLVNLGADKSSAKWRWSMRGHGLQRFERSMTKPRCRSFE